MFVSRKLLSLRLLSFMEFVAGSRRKSQVEALSDRSQSLPPGQLVSLAVPYRFLQLLRQQGADGRLLLRCEDSRLAQQLALQLEGYVSLHHCIIAPIPVQHMNTCIFARHHPERFEAQPLRFPEPPPII